MKYLSTVMMVLLYTTCAYSGAPSEEALSEPKRLFKEIQRLYSSLEIDQVRVKLKELAEKYPAIKKENLYTSLLAELEVIGKDAAFNVKQWIQGRLHLDDSGVTLLVFWESWCPHCQDDMPSVQKLHEQFHEKGLNVVGITRMTQTANLTSVIAFVAERDLSFPIAKVEQSMADYYDVRAVPAAALVKKGKVIWRGKPQGINKETIEKALAD